MFYQNSITAIITTYNSASYINKTLESVFNQTIKIEKIIIVDDCSFDFNQLEKNINEIKVNKKNISVELIKNKENKGPGFSRNVAWDKVNTEYIAFLDSDDIWETNKLEKQLNIFRSKNNLTLVSTAKNRKFPNFKTGFVKPYNLIFRNFIPLSSVLIRSKITHRFAEKYYSEDYDLWLNLLFNDFRAYLINERLCYENSQISKKNLSNNYLSMTIETQKTLSKLYYKKKSYFLLILSANVLEMVKFIIRILTKK